METTPDTATNPGHDGPKYGFQFAWRSPYGHVVKLLERLPAQQGVVLDLGCGHGLIAEPLVECGFQYVGADLDQESVDALRRRGQEAHQLDLSAGAEELSAAVARIVDGRDVAAVLLMDILEHLPQQGEFLGVLRDIVEALGRPTLVASVPNVGHYDVAAKLLCGRWEVTPTGLLDETHLTLFTEQRLIAEFRRWGWGETARADFMLGESDQFTPPDHPALLRDTSLSQFLRELRSRADDFGAVNQFVRAFEVVAMAPSAPETHPADQLFLTVVMRTQGRREALLIEALTALAAQTDPGFDVELVLHSPRLADVGEVESLVNEFEPAFANRVRVTQVLGGGRARPLNTGLALARGTYVAFLDDDDVVTAHWVEEFRRCSTRRPGSVIRAITADQRVRPTTSSEVGTLAALSGFELTHAASFDLVEHLFHNRTPICSFAVPSALVRELRLTFDESLSVVEDWDLLLRSAIFAGVTETSQVTSLYRRWAVDEGSSSEHASEAWDTARRVVQDRLDRSPLLLPAGSATHLAHLWAVADGPSPADFSEMHETLNKMHETLNTYQQMVRTYEQSLSWRITRPLRRVTAIFRRFGTSD